MSVDSGLSGPVEVSSAATASRATATTGRPRVRRGVAATDALADAVSTPSFRGSRRGRPRRRGRRVTRIIRRIELWSVLKIAMVFNTIMLGVALGAVALLWGLANTTGLIDDFEGFLQDAGFEDFTFRGEQLFEQVAFIGAVGALATTVFMVLSVALINLISEITGGIRFVVIEEIIEPSAPTGPRLPPAPLALPTAPPSAASPPRGMVKPPPPPGPGPSIPKTARVDTSMPARPPRPGRERPKGAPPDTGRPRDSTASRPPAGPSSSAKTGAEPTRLGGARKKVTPAKGGPRRPGPGRRPTPGADTGSSAGGDTTPFDGDQV